MTKVTYYGYFGRTANVKDAPIDGDTVSGMTNLFAALPSRHRSSATILPFGKNGGRAK
ncbi:hypothetical protein BH09PSE4_BH09PSE4_13870 [soil metagenome]